MRNSKLFFILVAVSISIAFQPEILAQGSTSNETLASQYFQEVRSICEKDRHKIWGVSLCGPVLLVDKQTRTVMANVADRQGALQQRGNIFVGTLPAKENIANTAVEWAGIKWTMLMMPLPENKVRRANLMAHELWHRIQDDLGFPGSGAENSHLATRDGRIWLQLEWRALIVALASEGKQRREAIADALLFRSYRRMIFPRAASEERAMEMHEGLAEYTGVILSGSSDVNQYVITKNLNGIQRSETFVRSFAYASGPAYGVLLDQTKSMWRKNLKKEDDLGNLLQDILSIKLDRDMEKAARSRAAQYDGEKLFLIEAERENTRQKLLAAYRARFVDGPVLAMPLRKMNMQFNPGNLFPLDSIGTVYPDIRIVDAWGILTVVKGGALINSNFTTIYVSTMNTSNPSNSSFLQGDGWTLELNPGWVVTKGTRSGDFILSQAE